MVFIHPIRSDEKDLFQDTSYASMPAGAMEKMLAESLAKSHDGRYFELFAVRNGDIRVGIISLYETAPGEISCGPEIKPQYRKQGFACAAVCAALEYAKQIGYTKAVAQIRQDNAASIALHQKSGFTLCRSFTNKNGNPVLEFERPL